eukprot:13010554-Alexandrium_andersonii.AAC.1
MQRQSIRHALAPSLERRARPAGPAPTKPRDRSQRSTQRDSHLAVAPRARKVSIEVASNIERSVPCRAGLKGRDNGGVAPTGTPARAG